MLSYLPARDGLLSLGWNITYPGPPIPKDPTYGVGTSTHRTTLSGATIEFRFKGTAAYLLGDAPAGSYTVSIDKGKAVPGKPDSARGVLAALTGLHYADHTIHLTVVKSVQVSVSGAILTVGMGKPGVSPRSRVIEAVLMDGSIRSNPFFDFRRPDGTSSQLNWKIDSPKYRYNSDNTPMLLTGAMTTAGGKSSQGSTASFTLNETSAFFIRGGMLANASEDRFSVTITPPSKVGRPQSRTFMLNSSWGDPNEILFFESGLNRDLSYGVQIKSEVAGKDTFFGFRTVETLDAGSFSANAASHALSSNAFAGLAILFVCMFRKLLR